jgi:hypothetical protein
MADRTRDIVRLRKAARLCRAKVDSAGPGAADFGRLANEIDGLVCSLSAELALQRRRISAGVLR